MSSRLYFYLLLLFFSHTGSAQGYQDGDLIFIESQSAQAKALREATDSRWTHVGILFQENSKWYVAEASQPVRTVPLQDFNARGVRGEYRIYRLPTLNEAQRSQLRTEVQKYLGRGYDIYFEWSDELIYCSELVYKTYQAIGFEIGVLQKFSELRLNGPYVKELIRQRTRNGHTLDLEEPIVTPVSQLNDSDLFLVEKNEHTCCNAFGPQ